MCIKYKYLAILWNKYKIYRLNWNQEPIYKKKLKNKVKYQLKNNNILLSKFKEILSNAKSLHKVQMILFILHSLFSINKFVILNCCSWITSNLNILILKNIVTTVKVSIFIGTTNEGTFESLVPSRSQ